MALASSKHDRGNKLGKRAIGTVAAREPEGSRSFGTKAVDGRTAKPLRIDQSFMIEIRYSDWSEVKDGG